MIKAIVIALLKFKHDIDITYKYELAQKFYFERTNKTEELTWSKFKRLRLKVNHAQ